MAPAKEDLVFYPAFCFKASPTHFTWVKMASTDVHHLKRRKGFEDQGIYFYRNYPIQFVCLVGVVIARTEVERRTILTLDDSSGATTDVVVLKAPLPPPLYETRPQKEIHSLNISWDGEESSLIHCSATSRSKIDITSLVPGAVAKVKGTLSAYRSVVQVQLERYEEIRDTNAEVQFLSQRVRFLMEVLCVPWVLTEREVNALREEADREEESADLKRHKAEWNRQKLARREERDRMRILKRWEWEEKEREKGAEDCRLAGMKLMRDMKRRYAYAGQ